MKRKVKTAAALLAVLTLAAAMPAASYANDGTIKIYAAKDADTRGTNDNLVVMAYNPLSNTPGNCRYAYWDFDMAELFEKMPQDSFVQSVTFHTRSKNFYHSETGINFRNITETSPENGSGKADPKGGISVTFSSEIKDISPSDIIIKDKSGNTVPLSSGDISRDGKKFFISKRLKPYESYGVTLSESIADVNGNALCGISFSFTTRR